MDDFLMINLKGQLWYLNYWKIVEINSKIIISLHSV